MVRTTPRLQPHQLSPFTDAWVTGARGYAVTSKKGATWKGHKTHMGWDQAAAGDCIFTDAQAAIWRMTTPRSGICHHGQEAYRHSSS